MSDFKSNQSKDTSSFRRETSQLTELMTERLQDQSIVNRYGTSLKISMGRDYTNYLNEKYDKLKQEFKLIDKNSDNMITFDELFSFMQQYEKKTGIALTREYIQDVFDFMDQDQGSTISVQEFILSYMVIEEKLRHKQIHLKQVIDEYLVNKKKYEQKLSENKDEELNAFGVSKAAELTIAILDCISLKTTSFSGNLTPYVLVMFDQKEQSTHVVEESFNPVWNETLEFNIRSLDCPLELRVIDKITKDVIGVARLNIKDFSDQNLTEKTMMLKPMSGSENMGEIRIRLRVFWSKLRYFKGKIQECEDKIEQAKKESSEVNQYLKLLDEPFGLIIYGQINNLKDEDVLEVPKEKEGIMDKARLSVMPTQNKSIQSNLATKLDTIIGGTLSKLYYISLHY